MSISKEKLKLIGGGIVVLAAASLMLQPVMTYLAGLGRLISFILTVLLLAYLFTFIAKKMRGSKRTTDSGTAGAKDDIVDADVTRSSTSSGSGNGSGNGSGTKSGDDQNVDLDA